MADEPKNRRADDFIRPSKLELLIKTQQLQAEAELRLSNTQAKLLSELQGYQVELETQNRDLRKAQQQLREAHDRYADLYDFAPVGYMTLNQKGCILESNLMATALLGDEQADIIGKSFSSWLVPEQTEAFSMHLHTAFKSPGNTEIELKIQSQGQIRDVRLRSAVISHSTNERRNGLADPPLKKERRSCRTVLIDITERKKAEQALRHEHERAQKYLDIVEAIIVALDRDGRVTLINRKGAQLLGYPENEIIGKQWFSSFLPQPDGMETVLPVFMKIMSGHLEEVEYLENNIITQSGKRRLIAWHNTYLQDEQGRITGVLSAGEDITLRTRAEAKTRNLLRENRWLTRGMFNLQEMERQHISRELHDELGQWLTAIQAEAEVISNYSGCSSCPEKFAAIQTSADAINNSAAQVHAAIRVMVRRLRPAILDALGLEDSLRELVAQCGAHHPNTHYNLVIDCKLDGLGEFLNITTYRIIQEALTNVASYAQASQVSVLLQRIPGKATVSESLQLTIKDDGKGMNPAHASKGMGLLGMRERVIAAEGEFSLHSRPGRGVQIDIQLPIKSWKNTG